MYLVATFFYSSRQCLHLSGFCIVKDPTQCSQEGARFYLISSNVQLGIRDLFSDSSKITEFGTDIVLRQ